MRIMIVDDDFVVRAKLREIFKKYGECTCVSGGLIAIKMFERSIQIGNPYDLISLDLDMPDLLGIETLKLIREWEAISFSEDEYDPVKFLIVTGAKGSQSPVTAFSLGCQGFITKPISQGKIRAAMEEVFGLTVVD